VSKRTYKPAWPLDDVRKFLLEQKGRKFDPRLIEVLMNSFDLFEQIKARLPD